MTRRLQIAPAPILQMRSAEVVRFDKKLRSLVTDMFRVMHEEQGIGLAAAQTGESLRVIVVDLGRRRLGWGEEEESVGEREEGEEAEGEILPPLALVNPIVVHKTEETRVYEEGCLSFPDVRVEIERPREVTVRYQDIEGKEHEVHAEGLLSICLQHEMDHLDGKTIVDYLSRLKRSLIMRKFAKQAREDS